MKFEVNSEDKSIVMAENGKMVARLKDSVNPYMYIPDVDPDLGSSVALHVLNGLNRVHDARFGEAVNVANILSRGDFEDEIIQKYSSNDKFSLKFSEKSLTIRVAETNHMLMNLNLDDGQWQFDFDGGAPEQLVQQTYLRFHALGDAGKSMGGEQLVEALSAKKLENKQDLSMGL